MTLRSATTRRSAPIGIHSIDSDRRALRRGLQTTPADIPEYCYDNLLTNPTFSTGAHDPWEKHSVVPDFTLQTVTPGAGDDATAAVDDYALAVWE